MADNFDAEHHHVSNDPNQQLFGDAVAMLGNILVIGDTGEGANGYQNGAAYNLPTEVAHCDQIDAGEPEGSSLFFSKHFWAARTRSNIRCFAAFRYTDLACRY